MPTTKSVSCVLLGHENKEKLFQLYLDLQKQTHPPDELILCACCMDICDLSATIRLTDDHINDTGQRFCDWGLRLSNSDYTFFASSDDSYDPEFIEKMLDVEGSPDLILAGFRSHLVGEVVESEPVEGRVTRGSFLVKTSKGKKVGYNSREYSGDYHFVRDMIDAGATWAQVPEILHYHN